MKEEEYCEINDGFTFKKLWNFIKMALPYILVCVVIVTMIGVAGSGIVSEVGKAANEKVQAIFELTYDGADDGMSASGKQLDIQQIKSIGRITEVLKVASLNFSASEIQNAITINGYYSPAMREIIDKLGGDEKKALELIGKIKLYPTQFVLNLNYKAVSGLSANQAVIIIDELLKIAKSEDFGVIHSNSFIPASEYDLPEISGLVGMDKVNFLNSELAKLNVSISTNEEIDNTTKSLVIASLNKTAKTVVEAEYYALSNGAFITEINSLDSEIAKVNTMITKVNGQIAVNAERVKDQKESIDALAESAKIIVNDKGEIINGGAYVTALYNQLYDRYSDLLDEKAELPNLLKQFENQKQILDKLNTDGFTTPSKEVVDKANAKLQLAFTDVKTTVATVENALGGRVNQYGGSMKIAMAPVYTNELMYPISWMKCILISVIVGILIGAVAAYPLDKLIKKKKLKKLALAVEPSGDVACDVVNTDNDNKDIADKQA